MDISKMTLEEIQEYVTELEDKVNEVELRRNKALNRVALIFSSINRAIAVNDIEKVDISVSNDIQCVHSPDGRVKHSNAPYWRHFKISLLY